MRRGGVNEKFDIDWRKVMTETDPKNPEVMKRFLFHESHDAEREALEERFFSDEELFYDLLELENSLVDAYARGELTGDELRRFEASLEKSPERREKIANAIALVSLITEEKQASPKTVPAAETLPGFWEKISSFFNLQMSAMRYASAALIFLLVCGTGFLFYERFRLNQELANLRERQKNVEELQKQESNLQDRLNEIQERERNLQNQITEKQGESEILNQQLETERMRREQIENELDRLRKLQKNLPGQNPPQKQPPKPLIATVVLSPFLGSRGAGGNDPKTVKLDAGVKSVSATLQLPKEATAEIFLVRFKGKTIASNQKPRTTKSGLKFLTVTIPANQLSTAEDNVISVFGSDGVGYDFIFKVQK